MTTVSRTVSYQHTAGPYTGDAAAMTLIYDSAQPYTVVANFGVEGGPWSIWRDILARRVDGKAVCLVFDGVGEGGADCEVAGLWAYLTLAGVDFTVTIRMLAAELDAFLHKTETLVPYGAENLDFNAELDALLKDGAR